MDLPLDAAARFQKFMFAAWTLHDCPQRELMTWARIDPKRRNSIWRSCHTPRSRIEVSEAQRLIDVAVMHPLIVLPSSAVWDWITGKLTEAPPQIHELIISAGFHPRNFSKLITRLSQFEDHAETQLAWSAVIKISGLTKDVASVVNHNCTACLGPPGSRICSMLNEFHKLRSESLVQGLQGPAKRTLLYFHSDLLHLSRGTGLFAGTLAEQRAEAVREFAELVINVREHNVGIVNDLSPDVPRDLIAHFRRFDGIFVLDQKFLMKVHHGGLFRTSCVGIDDSSSGYILSQLQKLKELKSYVKHGWTKSDMMNEFMSYMPDRRHKQY